MTPQTQYQAAMQALSVKKPIHFQKIKFSLPGNGASQIETVRMDQSEGLIVQDIHVNIWDKNGPISPERLGAFNLTIENASSQVGWQNSAFSLNVFKELGKNTVWRGFTLGAGTETFFNVSHDPTISPSLYTGATPQVEAPYWIEIVLVGIKIPGTANFAS